MNTEIPMHGVPCGVCGVPARSWIPGAYVTHDGGLVCRLQSGEGVKPAQYKPRTEKTKAAA